MLWPKAYADEIVERFRHKLETGEPYIVPERIEERRDRGVTEYYEWRIGRVPLSAGRYDVVCYFRDISSQVFARQAIASLNQTLERRVEERTQALEAEMAERHKIEAMLQQSQRLEAIGQLTGGAAHDFNNLLTVILANLDLVQARLRHADGASRLIAAAQHAAKRGAHLTSQLLAFSRHQQLEPVTISVQPLILNLGDLVRRAVGEAVTVEISSGRELWPAHLDRARFESAILNLDVNARDAMPDGGRLVIAASNGRSRLARRKVLMSCPATTSS